MNRNSVPIYIEIADILRKNIEQGEYRVGEKLPTEVQLSDRFGVNRHTVRCAIALLKSEGLLKVENARGVCVAGTPIYYPIGKRVRYNESLKNQGFETRFQLLQADEIVADSFLAYQLEISEGESVALIERLTFADDEPFCIASSHFPSRYFPNILSYESRMWSVSALLREVYGCDHIRRKTHVSARVVKPQDAQFLKLPLNSPILFVESINVDQDGHVIEYGITRFRGDCTELVFPS